MEAPLVEPKWTRVVRDLRADIERGRYPAGAVLPREQDLMRSYELSRDTIRRATAQLEREGLVSRVRKRGTVVRSYQRMLWRLSDFEHPDHTGLATADAWETDATRQGRDPSGGSLHVRTIAPPPDVAAKLKLDPSEDLCVARYRVRFIDGRPVITNDDYFDERIVRGTELATDADTTREDILSEAGFPQVYDVDEITVRSLTAAEAERLNMESGTPAAEHVRTGFTADDRAVRVSVSVVPGEALVLQYVVPT